MQVLFHWALTEYDSSASQEGTHNDIGLHGGRSHTQGEESHSGGGVTHRGRSHTRGEESHTGGGVTHGEESHMGGGVTQGEESHMGGGVTQGEESHTGGGVTHGEESHTLKGVPYNSNTGTHTQTPPHTLPLHTQVTPDNCYPHTHTHNVHQVRLMQCEPEFAEAWDSDEAYHQCNTNVPHSFLTTKMAEYSRQHISLNWCFSYEGLLQQ